MFKRFATALYLRRVSRDLTALVAETRTQNQLLARLADQFAPLPSEAPGRAQLSAETGVSYLDPDEAVVAQSYVAKTYLETGHLPDDEEILIHLADEKTTNLAERLSAREAELARLMEARR